MMDLYTVVYILDRDVDIKVKTFSTRKDALAYKNKLVFDFACDHDGLKSINKNSSSDKYFCYVEAGYTNAQVHIIKS